MVDIKRKSWAAHFQLKVKVFHVMMMMVKKTQSCLLHKLRILIKGMYTHIHCTLIYTIHTWHIHIISL